MDYNNNASDSEQQMRRIIAETNEILQNFHEISELMVNRITRSDAAMYNLGRRIVNEVQEQHDTSQIIL